MEVYQGKVLHRGIAIGEAHFLGDGSYSAEKRTVDDAEAEEKRYLDAKKKAGEELLLLEQDAAGKIGAEDAKIFKAQATLLDDEELNRNILDRIFLQHESAEYAVFSSVEHYRAIFSRMEDKYLAAKASDLLDIARRLSRILTGILSPLDVKNPSVIMAPDLLPSETLQLDRRFMLAFVTEEGSPLSHTAILARGLDIPALCGIPVDRTWDGHQVIVDAEQGRLILDPDRETLDLMEQKQSEKTSNFEKYKSLIGQDSVTSDGKPIRLYANITEPRDITAALENDAEGVGLFRTEFLYMGRKSLPDEEEQYDVYKSAAKMMKGKPLIIRTIDLGAEKQSQVLDLAQERNPALGFRGIRICLTRPKLFCTQLRAICRASVYGRLSIMFPMITSVKEVLQIRKLLFQVQDQLTSENIPWKHCPIGIMIETPSSVLLSAELAQEVDFFSIGTNDLTQYTLAMDRQNGSLDPFYDPYSEAVMREIAFTVKNGHRFGCLVGICGELAADTTVTDRLLKMGVDALSVSPHMVLPLREAIRRSNTDPVPAAV